jgi:hypothetical protein
MGGGRSTVRVTAVLLCRVLLRDTSSMRDAFAKIGRVFHRVWRPVDIARGMRKGE